jgi:hypothetical protein
MLEGHNLIKRVIHEFSMLRVNINKSHSEHDLYIRLFLTSGGGW